MAAAPCVNESYTALSRPTIKGVAKDVKTNIYEIDSYYCFCERNRYRNRSFRETLSCIASRVAQLRPPSCGCRKHKNRSITVAAPRGRPLSPLSRSCLGVKGAMWTIGEFQKFKWLVFVGDAGLARGGFRLPWVTNGRANLGYGEAG